MGFNSGFKGLNRVHVKIKHILCHFNNYELYKGYPATCTMEFFCYHLSSSTDVYWKNILDILMLCAASHIQIFQLRISNDGEVNLMQPSKLGAVSGDVRLK